MRPIFCGNFEYDARESDLERIFRRYGKVDRIDMKSGFAFVYMDDERDAEDAIRALDQIEFGRKGRRLRVEWTKQERGGSRRPEISRKPSSTQRPSKTLFVINFDTYSTRTRDLERHFDPYGKIVNVRIRKNFAFIQYESEEDAIKALDATNMSKLLGRVITVEFAMKDDDERRNEFGSDRALERSPRRGHGRVRSPSPYRRERGSPDYGQGRGRSSSPHRRERASPVYAHGSSRSPSRKERDSDYRRRRSPSPRNRRDSDRSPRNRRDSDPSPKNRRDSDLSPKNLRDPELNHKNNSSPQRERSNGDADHVPKSGKNVNPDYGRSASASPREEGEKVNTPDDYGRDRSPAYSNGESPRDERYGSQSPGAREMP